MLFPYLIFFSQYSSWTIIGRNIFADKGICILVNIRWQDIGALTIEQALFLHPRFQTVDFVADAAVVYMRHRL